MLAASSRNVVSRKKRGRAVVKPYEKVIGISCRQLVDYCMDYLSGSLPAEDRENFDGHLAGCPDCVKFFDSYKKTPEVSRDALTLEMPERVRGEVRDFLRQRYRKTP
jgi:anti-sigma factor RsiW